jgi:hypothetical protein
MRPSNAPSNVALYKNLESVVIAPHLLEKICRLASGENSFWCPLSRPASARLRDCLWCSACLHCFPRVFLAATALGVCCCGAGLASACSSDVKICVASRSHCQTICEWAKRNCSPGGTIQKTGMFSWSGIRAGDMIAIPLPNMD